MPVQRIVEEVTALVTDTRASFILDTLELCARAALLEYNTNRRGADEPQADDTGSKRSPGKHGRRQEIYGQTCTVPHEVRDDQLKGRTDLILDRVFVTHSGMDDTAIIDRVVERIRELQPFKEVFVTQASCTISAHSGRILWAYCF